MQNDRIINVLKSNKINPTKQRLVIAKFMLAKHQHLTAEEVYSSLKAEHNIAKATVYNTLGLFVQKAILKHVIIDSERVVYDSNTLPHHHIYNLDTSELQDIDSDSIALIDNGILPQNTQISSLDCVIKVRNTL